MSSDSTVPPVEVRRIMGSSNDKVFEAFTRPDVLLQWWRAGEGYTPSVAEVDLTVGGRYRLGMRDGHGTERVSTGAFREIEPGERLVYTWAWEGDGGAPGDESLVTLEFFDFGDASEVVVTHSGLESAAAAEQHRKGWDACLLELAKLV